MSDFTIHNEHSAPPAARPLLEKSRKNFGMVPNLYGVMAESPPVLEAYQVLGMLFRSTSLSTTEQHVVWLTINFENNCHYCVPAHTASAKMDDVPEAVINALRDGNPLPEPKLEALRRFTVAVVNKRGLVSQDDLSAFADAGFNRQQVLEVILGVTHKVLSNYTNHIADTPLDEPFKQYAWEKPGRQAA